jgi:DnaK suppressor protein
MAKTQRASRNGTSAGRRGGGKAPAAKPAPRRKSAAKAGSRNGAKGEAARVKEALLAKRAETLALLERSADYGKQRLREDAEDLVDQATDSQAREVVYALSSAEGNMIRLIDGALERLDEGEYGVCISCGEPIQKRRLQAVPWATLCVPCKELQEQGVLD